MRRPARSIQTLWVCLGLLTLLGSTMARASSRNPERIAAFEYYRGKDRLFYFRLKSNRGTRLIQSEPHATLADAEQTANAVIGLSILPETLRPIRVKRYWFAFEIVGPDGMSVGQSDAYTGRENRDLTLEAFDRLAANAGHRYLSRFGTGWFETIRDAPDRHAFRLRASHGKPLLWSEAVPTDDALVRLIEATRRHASDARAFEQIVEAGGGIHLVLKAPDGRVLARTGRVADHGIPALGTADRLRARVKAIGRAVVGAKTVGSN